jgi:hypothetical protein
MGPHASPTTAGVPVAGPERLLKYYVSHSIYVKRVGGEGELCDIDHCWKRLRNLADHALTDPREQAIDITRSFKAGADQHDIDTLKRRLHDELTAKTLAQAPLSELERHSRWLAVLNAAERELG